jgi:trans-aconitate 2-methyltransferase
LNDSATGRWDAAGYDEKHNYVWEHGAGLVELLSPREGERILDLGCGTGHLTAEIAAAGAEVLGIDSSPAMIERARTNYPALRFEVADGADFTSRQPFDAVFSNAAIHWMRPPERVAGAVSRAMAPGGRLVAEFGGRGNVAAITDALHAALRAAGDPSPEARSPWYFPSVGAYAALLERHALSVRLAALFDRPTRLDGGEQGLRNWLEMFAAAYVSHLPPPARADVMDRVERELRPRLFRDGAWYADYVRLRVVAVKG